MNDTNREPTTLEFVQKQQPGFKTPNILHQAEHNGRSYIFLTRVLGRTFIKVWPALSSELDLPCTDIPGEEHWWRWEVQDLLGAHGFEDSSSKWGLGGALRTNI